MKKLCHSHRALLYILLYIAIVSVFLLSFTSYPIQRQPTDARINEIHSFARIPDKSCKEIGDPSKLKLIVNGMDTGLRAVGCADAHPPSEPPTVSFMLHHERAARLSPELDQAVWKDILGNPLETIRQKRTLRYEIHLPRPDGKPDDRLEVPDNQFGFYIFEPWSSSAAVAAVVLVWGLLIYLACYSALLRDAAASDTPLEKRTFSLAKTQMAWWFAIVFAAFVFLWLVTGELPTLNGQALSLLGISSATTIASLGISAGRTPASGFRGVFFHDLLSDSSGIAIQRFQMLVMTVSLGLMFLQRVATRLTMPEFDPSLLVLLGISAGTYVGLKIPETQRDEGNAASGAAAADDPKAAYAPTP